jgi:hypothetical protein
MRAVAIPIRLVAKRKQLVVPMKSPPVAQQVNQSPPQLNQRSAPVDNAKMAATVASMTTLIAKTARAKTAHVSSAQHRQLLPNP